MGLQNLNTLIHCTGSNQNFRYKNFAVAELFTDDAHASQKAVLQNFLGCNALIQSLLDGSLYLRCAASLEQCANFLKNCHNNYPPQILSDFVAGSLYQLPTLQGIHLF